MPADVHKGITASGRLLSKTADSVCRFTVTQDFNFGPYLESINGVSASVKDKTYWELLSKKPGEQKYTPLSVGEFIKEVSDSTCSWSQSY